MANLFNWVVYLSIVNDNNNDNDNEEVFIAK